MNLFALNPTLEERVGIVYRRLVLIQAADQFNALRWEQQIGLIAAAPELLDDAKQNDNAFTWLAEQMNSLTDNAKHWTVAQIEALGQDLRIEIERNQKRTRVAIAKAEGGQ